jgi:hypothetical protein
MARRLFNNFHYLVNETDRRIFMKKIAHRTNENRVRAFPAQRFFKRVAAKRLNQNRFCIAPVLLIEGDTSSVQRSSFGSPPKF